MGAYWFIPDVLEDAFGITDPVEGRESREYVPPEPEPGLADRLEAYVEEKIGDAKAYVDDKVDDVEEAVTGAGGKAAKGLGIGAAVGVAAVVAAAVAAFKLWGR